jgi:hypothetical protein
MSRSRARTQCFGHPSFFFFCTSGSDPLWLKKKFFSLAQSAEAQRAFFSGGEEHDAATAAN